MARFAHRETGQKNLVLAGGVALNCVANGRLCARGRSRTSGSARRRRCRGALGAALFVQHQLLYLPRVPAPEDAQQGSLLGPSYSDEEIRGFLDAQRIPYRAYAEETRCSRASRSCSRRSTSSAVPGRMEFGPRALGCRRHPRRRAQSADAVRDESQDQVSRIVPPVRRPAYCKRIRRSFALPPGRSSPYMLLTADVRAEKRLPLPPEAEPLRGLERLPLQRSVIPRSLMWITPRASRRWTRRATGGITGSCKLQATHRLPGPHQHELQISAASR